MHCRHVLLRRFRERQAFLLDSPRDRLVPGRDQAVFCLSGVIRLPGPVRLLFPARARAASLSRAAGTVPLPGTARAVLFAGALTFSLGSGGALAFSGGRSLGAEAVSGAVPRGIAAVGAAL